MRIVLVTLFYPPARREGTENYTLTVASHLVARGHEVHVVCAGAWSAGPNYFNGVTEEMRGGVHLSQLQLNWTRAGDPNRVLYDSVAVERWFGDALAGIGPDLVHVVSTITLGVGVLRAAHRRRLPLVLTLMDFWFLCPRIVLRRGDGELCDGRTTDRECEQCLMASSHAFRRLGAWVPQRGRDAVWHAVCRLPIAGRFRGARGLALDMRHRRSVMRQSLELPDLILSHSRFVRDTFAAAGASSRVRHLPNGHDLAWRARAPRKQPATELRLGFVGQIAEHKGLHTLVEAYRLAGRGLRASLNIWGDPCAHRTYAEALRAATADVPSIRWRGPFEHGAVGGVLSDIDVLVVPSNWYENWPLVIQEAFASGTPVVATNLGGMAEAVSHGVNGLLFERNDAGDLARQLRRLVDEPGLVAKLSAGIPRVKTIAEEVSELESAYSAVIERRRQSPE